MSTVQATRQELAKQVREEAEALAAAVEAAETKEQKSDVFFKGIRESCIPYLPCVLRDDPEQLYSRCYDGLFILARANLPLAVGFAMHQYNLAALATLPVPSVPEFENRRKILVDSVQKYKSLLCISSFGANIRSKGTANPNVVVDPNERGEFVCNGRKNFQSMATKADILIFSGYLPNEEMGMFYCQLAGQKAIVPGESLFAGAMSLTDTKPLTMTNLVLKRRNVLALEEWLTYHVSNYATSWFESLVSAAYLGGASKALDEVRKFARSVSHDQETMLAELDGFQLEAGRLAARHRAGLAFGQSFGPCAAKYCRSVIDEDPVEIQEALSDDIMDISSAIKYTTTKVAQDIVNGARALVGSRSMAVTHPIFALTEQICFGPLHPIIPARHERETGEELLGEEPYYGTFRSAYG
jgi:alkylation response protein AidB-like acyl-CoA dehydrogenase